MKIRIVAIGKVKERFTSAWINEFLKRLGKYGKVEILEIKESNKEEESKKLLAKMKEGDYKMLLDIRGKQLYSREFSDLLQRQLLHSNITFFIGGPEGVTKDVEYACDEVISLSTMTFTHQMARLFLIEQIYRAFTIMKGEKYHK